MDFKQRRYKPAYWLRALKRPKYLGQRRYLLVVRSGPSIKSDPGYLSALTRMFRHRLQGDLVITEQIAVPAPDRRLVWVSGGDQKATSHFLGPRSLWQMRKAVRALNKNPLGYGVRRDVDKSGLLEISRTNRYFARLAFTNSSSFGVEENQTSSKKFDVTDKAKAAEAIDYYRALQEEVEQADREDVNAAIERAKSGGDEKTRSLFVDPEISQRIAVANQFSSALARGQFDKIEQQITERERVRERRSIEEQRKKNQLMSERAQRTIQSLTRDGNRDSRPSG